VRLHPEPKPPTVYLCPNNVLEPACVFIRGGVRKIRLTGGEPLGCIPESYQEDLEEPHRERHACLTLL
jgi:hypothetical protein